MNRTVTTWYLEQTSPGDLRPSAARPAGVRVALAAVPSPEFSRFLYTAVGGDVRWTDRLPWTYARWAEHLAGTETWVAYERDTPAGFMELDVRGGAAVEIVQFGLLPAFRGRGIGGLLLSEGTARAWDVARRRPDREPTGRVWLHTCADDGEHALANYRRRGFRLYDTREEPGSAEAPPGPWPGAHPS